MERSFDINSIMLFKIWNEIITNYIQAIKDIIFFNSSLLVVALFMSFYAFLVIFLFGNWIGDRGSAFISIFFTFFSLLIVSIYIVTKFWDFWRHYFNYIFFAKPFDGGGFEVPVMRVQFGNWFSFTDFNISWGFIFDPLGLSMMWVVLFITFIVQIYCLDYMHGDPFISRFYAYLSIFSFFMLLLVVSDNYVQIFLGWEGVGLASFMLISFWSTRKDAVYAGMKALFVNRFGDVFFIWFMVIALKEFQSLNFVDINLICTSLDLSQRVEMVLLGFTLVIAAMAKSA